MSIVDDLVKWLEVNPDLQEHVVKPVAEALARHRMGLLQPELTGEEETFYLQAQLHDTLKVLPQKPIDWDEVEEQFKLRNEVIQKRSAYPPVQVHTREEDFASPTPVMRSKLSGWSQQHLGVFVNQHLDKRPPNQDRATQFGTAMDRKFFMAVDKLEDRLRVEMEEKRREEEEVAKLYYPDLSNI